MLTFVLKKMAPLIVLLSAFGLSLLIIKIFQGHFQFAPPGRIAMSVMLVFTAIGHFLYTKGMTMMIPDFIPFKTEIVYLTGLFEIFAAIGLIIPSIRTKTAWLLIAFFILILPANIWAAIHQVDYQAGTFDGNGLAYLWFRVPLQIVFIIWTYLSSIKN